MKLHLGCGQRYFEGYVNIDYPLSEHNVQLTSVADEFADLFELNYPSATIEEVRLHHVFEHFTRAQACSMLSAWNSWLKPGGRVHIEVPDFEKTAKAVLKFMASDKAQSVGLRHIFGSQEAHWAVHYEGYTSKRLKSYLEKFGYAVTEVRQTKYLDTYNLEVIATKKKSLTRAECVAATRSYLHGFLVAEVESEHLMLDTWMKDYEQHLSKSFSRDGQS
jgi:predicted SAM-dependent methyltransferase